MQYLFERLSQAECGDARFNPKEQLQLDILRQIQCIVAARPWLESSAPEEALNLLSFGATAVTDLARGNAQELARYGRRLEKLIAHYEPRLAQPSVAVEPSSSPLSPFRIVVSGALQTDDSFRNAQPVSFEAHPPSR